MKAPYTFTLKEIFTFAQTKGYNEYDVVIELSNNPEEVSHRVWFGIEDTEMWMWDFDDLTEMATDYQHLVNED